MRCVLACWGCRATSDVLREQEVHELILEELVKYLSSATEESTSLRRTYYWGPLEKGAWKKVQTTEEGRMISGGAFEAPR